MSAFGKFICKLIVCLCLVSEITAKDIPSYIDICKRDQDTIDDCARSSIEKLRPYLANGIEELDVPGIEPFVIPELVVDSGSVVQFKAVGRDVKVYGASNFTIKSLSVDLDSLIIKGRVRFPKLQFEGKYKLDARLLILPLHGQGTINANATKCDAELVLKGKLVERDGVEYLNFTSLDMDISIKDYRLQVDGLFNGDQALGDSANVIINQNRAEFLRASKPYVEKTSAKLLLDVANSIASGFSFDQLLPKP